MRESYHLYELPERLGMNLYVIMGSIDIFGAVTGAIAGQNVIYYQIATLTMLDCLTSQSTIINHEREGNACLEKT